MQIKAVLFDFGGVLGSDANSWRFNPDVCKKIGLSSDGIEEIYWSMWKDLKVGKKDLQDFFEVLKAASKTELSIAELRLMYHDNIHINEEMINLVKKLRNNYKTYIVSNESLEGLSTKIKKFELHNYFDSIFNSARLGFAKPEKKLFEYVLKEINLKPEETIFTDDQEKNIIAAHELEMYSFRFQTVKQLRTDLFELLE